MIKFFDMLFKDDDSAKNESISEHNLQLITATLLIEISKADFSQDEEELNCIHNLLTNHFDLSRAETTDLIQRAQQHSKDITSLQQMTRELNETLSQHDKVSIIELMWQVTYADGENNRYEEHLIRQVADLLYVSHAHFIQARYKAEN